MYAVIVNGVVVNVVVWDGGSDWAPPSGTSVVALSESQGVGVGYTYSGGTFTAPAVA